MSMTLDEAWMHYSASFSPFDFADRTKMKQGFKAGYNSRQLEVNVLKKEAKQLKDKVDTLETVLSGTQQINNNLRDKIHSLETTPSFEYEKRLKKQDAEINRLRDDNNYLHKIPAELNNRIPWPANVWTMTDDEYMAAVPDPKVRCAISGYMAWWGWNICVEAMKKLASELD